MRPASAPRPRQAVTEHRQTTGWVRGTILVAILIMLAVTIVPTLRSLMRQSSDIADLRDRVAAQSTTVDQLIAEQAKWSDPAYVEQQARERLKFVRVGDRSYTVIDPVADTAGAAGAPIVSAAAVNDSAPWYGRLWQSVLVADQPSAGLTSHRPR